MEEHWEIWQPSCAFKVGTKYFIEKVEEDSEGLHILLRDKDSPTMVIATFSGLICAYRRYEELVVLKKLSKEFKNREHEIIDWSFFIVNNSNFINQILEESQGMYSANGLVHYAIFAIDCLFEVATYEQPCFTVKTLGEATGTV